MSNESIYELTIVNMYMLKAKTEKKIITDYILKDVEPGMKSIGARQLHYRPCAVSHRDKQTSKGARFVRKVEALSCRWLI